jgi:catechol 2,3-dioxygenase-like lactoylglutathione lyase family enzyme
MKRFHVHLGVADLASSIRFYSDLFGVPPTIEKPDYAKWMLDDPRVNFAISDRGARAGLNHLGLQADSADELAGIRKRFVAADAESVYDERNVTCCYARGDKHWTRDPQGVAWEAFHTLDDVPVFGDDAQPDESAATTAGTSATRCCRPAKTVETNAMPNGCCR